MLCSHQLLPCDLLHKVATNTNHSHCTQYYYYSLYSVTHTVHSIITTQYSLTLKCHSHCTQYKYYYYSLYSITHTVHSITITHCTVSLTIIVTMQYRSLYTVLLTVHYHSLTLYTVLLLPTIQYHSVTVHSTTHWAALLTLHSITM